jgi:hypothetical protein
MMLLGLANLIVAVCFGVVHLNRRNLRQSDIPCGSIGMVPHVGCVASLQCSNCFAGGVATNLVQAMCVATAVAAAAARCYGVS